MSPFSITTGSRSATRAALLDVLGSGLVAPLNGYSALAAIGSSSGAGLLDQPIAENYMRAGLTTLTLDAKWPHYPAPGDFEAAPRPSSGVCGDEGRTATREVW